jgi:CheY-like chemotaxis protein
MTRGPGDPANAPDLVLIVEDEMPIAEALSEIITDAGYRVLIAGNGRVGLDLARAEHPALIITDLMMPYLDGAGLIAALRAEAPTDDTARIPVIVMTAAGRAYAERIPFDALLSKPFDILDVDRLLARFLRDGETRKQTTHPPTNTKAE